MVSREENEKATEKIKAWCPKCFMAFENGPSSQIVQNHIIRNHCATYICNKPNSNCVRKFRSINASNRHVYCYSADKTLEWNIDLMLPVEVTANEDFGFDKLAIDDGTGINFLAGDNVSHTNNYIHYPIQRNEGPPFLLPDSINLTEIFNRVGDILGQEFPNTTLNKFKAAFKRKGYTSACVFRLVRENQGSWEFLYRDFTTVGPEIEAISNIIKYLISQKGQGV